MDLACEERPSDSPFMELVWRSQNLVEMAAWQFPSFENADTLVDRLVRGGLVVRDLDVDPALHGKPVGMSPRTLQRRFLQATGLTQSAVREIERARYALTPPTGHILSQHRFPGWLLRPGASYQVIETLCRPDTWANHRQQQTGEAVISIQYSALSAEL